MQFPLDQKMNGRRHPQLPRVILDTDMGNDIDDALALVMLHSMARLNECVLLGVTISKGNPWAVHYTQTVNAYCGKADIPIGKAVNGKTPEDGNFIRQFSEASRARSNGEDAVYLLRRLLALEEDLSVTLISIGFFTNLAQLLASPADEISPYTGRELVARKVHRVCSMAGNFSGKFTQGPDVGNPEFNIRTDIESAKAFIESCPVPMVFSGFEIGEAILFSGSEIENLLARDPKNPVARGYSAYLPMPYDRPSWDQTAVLYAVRPDAGHFFLSSCGTVTVDAQGYTTFTPSQSGRHRYLILNATSLDRTLRDITELSTTFQETAIGPVSHMKGLAHE